MDAATSTTTLWHHRKRHQIKTATATRQTTTMVLAVKSSIAISRIATTTTMLVVLSCTCISLSLCVPTIHAFSLIKPVVKQPLSRSSSSSSSSLYLSSSSSQPSSSSSSSSSSAHLQPPFPHPTSPEEAIQNQLHYYQTNQLSKAYHNCCSPGNKKATGSLLEFERLVNLPPYDLIVGHERADVLMELVTTKPTSLQQQQQQPLRNASTDLADVVDDDEEEDEEEDDENDDDDDTIVKDVACCLVCIRPNRKSRNKGHPVWFWWEMSLIEMSTEQTMMTRSIAEDVGYDDDLFASLSTLALSSSSSSSMEMAGTSTDTAKKDTITRWMVDCIQPDFEDLEFETEYLSIENFLDDPDSDDDDEEGDDDDDDDDELTIYWDFNL